MDSKTMDFKIGYLFLVIILLFHTIINIDWLVKNTLPPAWDQSSYLIRSLFIYQLLENPSSDFLDGLLMITTYRPPLFYISPIPLYFLFGISDDTATMANVFFLAILLFSVYGIGRNLYDWKVGVLSSFIVTTFPIIFGLSRQFLVDFALTAMISLSIYLLILTNNFHNRKYSYMFGISIGLGMLTKWTYPVFIIAPLMCVLNRSFSLKLALYKLKGWLVGSLHRKKDLNIALEGSEKNFLIAGLCGLMTSSIWYLPHLDFINLFIYTGFGEGGKHFGPSSIFSMDSFLYYFVNLINFQISFFYFFMFLIALPNFIRYYKNSRLFIGSWIIVPSVIFTFVLDKDIRFTVPMLPAVAIILAAGFLRFTNSKIKTVLVGLLIIVGCLQFFAVSYDLNNLSPTKSVKTPIGEVILFTQQSLWEYNNWDIDEFWNYRIKREDWKVNYILDVMNGELKDVDRPFNVAVVSEYAWFNHMSFRYHSYQRKMPFTIYNVVHSPESLTQNFSSIDFVIIKDESNVNWILKENLDNVLYFFYEHSTDFEIIGKVRLPDDSNAIIYMRTENSSKS